MQKNLVQKARNRRFLRYYQPQCPQITASPGMQRCVRELCCRRRERRAVHRLLRSPHLHGAGQKVGVLWGLL